MSRALLGAALLSATATVHAAGGSWVVDPSTSCTPDSSGTVYVGVCKGSTDATGAKVIFDSTTGTTRTVERVIGGYSGGTGDATDNTVTVSGGKVIGSVYDGFGNGNATGNTVIVSGGDISEVVAF